MNMNKNPLLQLAILITVLLITGLIAWATWPKNPIVKIKTDVQKPSPQPFNFPSDEELNQDPTLRKLAARELQSLMNIYSTQGSEKAKMYAEYIAIKEDYPVILKVKDDKVWVDIVIKPNAGSSTVNRGHVHHLAIRSLVVRDGRPRRLGGDHGGGGT